MFRMTSVVGDGEILTYPNVTYLRPSFTSFYCGRVDFDNWCCPVFVS